MSSSNDQTSFANSWDDPRGQQTLQSPFEQRRPTDAGMSSAHPYVAQFSQRTACSRWPNSYDSRRISNPPRSSVSSLSAAMGTAPTSQRLSRSSEQSSGSSPSSEGSNHSNHHREQQIWAEMGIPGSSVSTTHTVQLQDMASPENARPGLISFENLDVNQTMHSPYTPPQNLTDLPGSSYSMAHSPYVQSVGRYGSAYLQRSSSTSGMGQSSSGMMLPQSYSHSAPNTGRLSGFPANVGMHIHNTPSPPNAFSSPIDESERLRLYIQELQTQNQELHTRVDQLQGELNASRFAQVSGMGSSADAVAGTSSFVLPTVSSNAPHGQSHTSAPTEASWRRRTDARVRKYCSPNRAGNALCAWHDTRRERRAYPPRMAPVGTLNCGCTVAEALFEESLSRHGVGSYLPGDNVRMDPALRNPLLRLLEARYGYRDGDFERDPLTGDWQEGDGHERWEAELQRHAGKSHR
ncbi:hypothetical protein DFH11DRAFT_1725651 [Phellopilus nigrolimitatus]|nr:hypothetical protein DFH11DRAFT_1725651 [Phellopilus nigrolimitatus]